LRDSIHRDFFPGTSVPGFHIPSLCDWDTFLGMSTEVPQGFDRALPAFLDTPANHFYPNYSSLGYLRLCACFRDLRGICWGAEDPEMLIEIRELEHHAVDFDEHLALGVLDLGPEVRQSGELSAHGRAQLVQEHHGKHQVINGRVDFRPCIIKVITRRFNAALQI
jgi:hypothetical protein